MNRAKVVILVILAVFPVVMTALVFPFVPDTIAFHFGSTGVDRWEDKPMLFLPSGIITVLSLFIVWVSWATQHPGGPNGEPLLLGNRGPMPFGICAGILGFLDVLIALYLGYNLMLPGDGSTTFAAGPVISFVIAGIVVLFMWVSAAVFISGKGTRFVNMHPGISEREKAMGDDTAQSRAVGFLLLFLSFVVLAMLLAPTLMK